MDGMSRSCRLVTVLALLVPALAYAQPADPPEPAPAPTPAPAVVPQGSLHDACIARRHDIEAAADHAADLDTRTKLLLSLPDCSKPDVALPPAPPTCGAGQQLLDGQCVGGKDEYRGATAELSAGITWANAGAGGYSLLNGAALNVGVGTFVTHDVAFSVRASGSMLLDNAEVWFGVIGPNVQGWFGKGFVGGGIGLGVAIGCAETCDASSTSGFDLRAGYRVEGAATLSFEVESLDGFFSQQSVTLASVLLGFQSF